MHVVAEMSNAIRKALLRTSKIYVGFRCISAKDYIVVARCNKCRDLGHVAKYGTKDEACEHCGSNGHKKDACPKKAAPATCIPCLRKGKKCTQKTTDCPTHKLMLERLIQKTGYE